MVLAFHLSGNQNKHFIHSFPALSNQLHQRCESDSLHHKCLSYPLSNPSPGFVSPSSFPPGPHQLFPLQQLHRPFLLHVGGQVSSLPGSDVTLLPLPHASCPPFPFPLLFLLCSFVSPGTISATPMGAIMSHHPSLLPHTEICPLHITSLTFPAPRPPHLMPQQPFPELVEALLHPGDEQPLNLHACPVPRPEAVVSDKHPWECFNVDWSQTAFCNHVCGADESTSFSP